VVRTRILLADDHLEIRAVVTRMLEREYEIVESVTDGQALLDAASRLNPDICVVDISMPIIDGIQAAAELKASGSTTKIIILTVHEDDDFVRASFENGASGYVVKARIATDLVAAVKEVLAGRTFVSAFSDFGEGAYRRDAR
jgi:DNA-binding NarL/FixJ family response regulator